MKKCRAKGVAREESSESLAGQITMTGPDGAGRRESAYNFRISVSISGPPDRWPWPHGHTHTKIHRQRYKVGQRARLTTQQPNNTERGGTTVVVHEARAVCKCKCEYYVPYTHTHTHTLIAHTHRGLVCACVCFERLCPVWPHCATVAR